MSIRIVIHSSGIYPHFFCDYCDDSISDAKRAVAIWRQKERKTVARMFMIHKHCQQKWIAANGTDYMTYELKELPEMLAANSRVK